MFFIQSCTSTLNYVGEYHSKYSPYGVTLNIDSTFNFYQNKEFNYEYSQGKWIFQSSNQLSLSSKIQSKYLSLKMDTSFVEENKIHDSLKVHFEISNMEDELKAYYILQVFSDSFLVKEQFCNDSIFYLPVNRNKNIVMKIKSDSRMPGRMFGGICTESINRINRETKININWIDSLYNFQIIKHEIIDVHKDKIRFRNHWLNRKNLK